MSIMYAASRDALQTVRVAAEEIISHHADGAIIGQQIGAELFALVDAIEENRTLRVALADLSATVDQRQALIRQIAGDKVRPETLEVCCIAVAQEWSSPADLRDGMVRVGRSCLLQSAEMTSTLPQVEEELFRLSRVITNNPQLEQALGDRSVSAEDRRRLLAQLLYGKVSAISEILAAQAVGRPQEGLVADDLDILSRQAAHQTGRRVADVTTPVALSEDQRERLRDKLRHFYGITVSIHEVVDPNIIGGMVIKVGHEIINGSIAHKLDALRRQLI